MPDFDPDAYLAAPQESKGFDPDAYLSSAPPAAETGIWPKIKAAGNAALSAAQREFNPFSNEAQQTQNQYLKDVGSAGPLNIMPQVSRLGQVGSDIGAIASAPTSMALAPVAQGIESGWNALAPSFTPEETQKLAQAGVKPSTGEEVANTALSAISPGRGVRAPGIIPPPLKPPQGPFGVLLSKGQETGELPLIRKEQGALRGQLGPQAEAAATDFAAQQKQQVADAHQSILSGFDPFGQQIAQGPQESGAIISNALKAAASAAKAGVQDQYSAARAFPGEIHAGAFEGIGNAIKDDLSNRTEPVIIDDKLTPYASAAIKDIDNKVANLNIQNRADPYGQPSQENIVGVNLSGVDQWRKRLSSFRNQAYQSGNAADGRATQEVLNAFDDHVDQAVNSGLFNGDPRAVEAWNDARAAYTDYRKTFTANKNDPVGRVVERILGKGNADPLIPNDVADYMYGSTGVNPSSLNVGVANRIKGIMGVQSPEWTAVKQGLFSRLTAPPPGVTEWGPGKIAQNLNKFLNGDGKEMAQSIFNPQERQTLQSFADLQRQLEVPPTGANRSETSTFIASMFHRMGGWLGMVVGASIARTALPFLPFGVSEGIGAGAAMGAKNIANRINAATVAKQMPMMADVLKKWNKANAAFNKANSPPSQAALGLATANLLRVFKGAGIDLSRLQMPSTGAANQNQQEVPGPPP